MKEILLLIEKSSHLLSYYDIQNNKYLQSISLPTYPHEFVVDHQSLTAYIGHYGVINSASTDIGGNEIIVIDIKNGKEKTRFNCGEEHRRPHGVALDNQGRLYALSESTSTLLIWENPLKNHEIDRRISVGGKKSHLFTITSNGEKCYSMNLDSNDVTYVQPYKDDFEPVSIHTGEKPEGNLLRFDEKMLYVVNRGSETLCAIDTNSIDVVKSVSAAGDPIRIFHDRSRNNLWILCYASKSILIYDEASLQLKSEIKLTAQPIAMSFSNTFVNAFVSTSDNTLLVIDLNHNQISKVIHTNKEPDVSTTVII